MAVINLELDVQYPPRTDDCEIIIEVLAGDGQLGAYSVYLETDLIDSNRPTSVGKKAQVLGKRSFVDATVRDTLEETNFTSILLTVSEGSYVTNFGPYSKECPVQFDTVNYSITLIH